MGFHGYAIRFDSESGPPIPRHFREWTGNANEIERRLFGEPYTLSCPLGASD